MARWEFVIRLERERGLPLFQQIARAIAADIRRGRLRPGDRLPGARTLAESLGVQRMTVVAAFDELVAEGWIVMRPARGAFVSSDLPEPRPRRFARERVPVRHLPPRAPYELADVPDADLPYDVPRGSLLFAPSRPDVRLAPADVIGRAYRRALSRPGGALLSYTAPEGHHRLRIALAKMLASTRGLSATHENICVTRGSQMALSLLARVLLRSGDVIAVEQLGYRPAYEIFRLAGAKAVPIPVDEHGLDTDALERVLEQQSIRAVYVTPHHQFPTTVTLSAARRMRLLELAREHRFAIIEDDYDYEFHYEGSPVLPLASADPHGVVIYIGTMSKVLAPALRIGYVAAPRNVSSASLRCARSSIRRATRCSSTRSRRYSKTARSSATFAAFAECITSAGTHSSPSCAISLVIGCRSTSPPAASPCGCAQRRQPTSHVGSNPPGTQARSSSAARRTPSAAERFRSCDSASRH